MPVIQNQLTTLSYLVAINGTEITEHNRKTSSTVNQSGSDVELARGIVKRYIQKNKAGFSLSFSFLPNSTDQTIDGRAGRDFLKTISQTRGTVTLSIKLNPLEEYKTYTCFVTNYSESLIRRDIENKYSYWDVSIDFEEQ